MTRLRSRRHRVAALSALALLALTSAARAQQGRWVRVEGWRHLFEPGSGDPGVGVVAFAWPDRASWADTLPLYRHPGDARAVGAFVFASDSARGWIYGVAWLDTLSTNLLEYGYEEVGLPFDSLSPDSTWARVIPGFNLGGMPARAWVALRPGVPTLVRWAERLTEHDLFFRDGVAPALFDAPDGAPVPFPPVTAGNYILHPLEARGPWLRVRVVTPSDMCDDPERPTEAKAWIRYLDDAGRPLVWYHTRGC